MPLRSKAQSRFMHWAESHPKQSGVPTKVSNEFITAQHGHSLKGLPERVPHKAHGGRAFTMKPKPTGW